MATPATLGTVIRQRRQGMGLTQQQFAERIGQGVRQAEVSRLEADRIALPRRARLERIAAALELTVGELLALCGWNGAETVCAPQTPEAPAPPSPRTVSDERSPSPDRAITGDLPPLVVRLRAAIERSREVRLHSQQIIADLHARYGDHETWLPPTSAEGGPEA